MKQRFFSLMALLALPLFMFAQVAVVPADTASNPCDRHYRAAVKFIVDTPNVHPFSTSSNGGAILFASGNLQYCPAKDEWRFALRQFDRCGNGMVGKSTVYYDSIDYSTPDNTTKSGFKEIPTLCNNMLGAKSYEGWIDLMGWGTSTLGKKVGDPFAIHFYPYECDKTVVNGDFNEYGFGPTIGTQYRKGLNNNFDTASGVHRWFDWGYGNNIREFRGCTHTGTTVHASDSTMYRPGVWRTPTIEEWTYILNTRKVGGQDSAYSNVRIKYGDTDMDTVSGIVIYPDDFSFSEAGVASMSFGNHAITNLNLADWNALEQVGCVFLPWNGSKSLNNSNLPFFDTQYCFYYSATTQSETNALSLLLKLPYNTSTTANHPFKYRGCCVRLVQDYRVK